MDKEYRISSIADFLQVPEDKHPELLADFATWLRTAKQGQKIADHLANLTGSPGKIQFGTDSFTWVDDGIRGNSGLDVVNAKDKTRIARIPLPTQEPTT